MPVLKIVFASIALALGLLATLMLVVLMFASMPNSKPEDLRAITRWLVLAGVGGLVCLGGGIWLLIAGHAGWSALVGAAPMVAFIVLMIWISLR